MNTRIAILAPLLVLGLAANAADDPGVTQLDPVEVTAEQRTESAFREVQVALERIRSDRDEDAEKIVCVKQKPTGSNIPVISCATNRYWNRIREASLQSGLGSIGGAVGGGGPGAIRTQDKVFNMSMSDYKKLQKRFGKMPDELKLRI